MVAAAERMAALGQMAASVAHEIRNPLALIGGFARRLGAKLSGDLKEYSNIIVEEVQRLEDILKDTLSFVKTSKIEKKEVNLNELLDNIVSLLEPTVNDKGNIITKEVEPGLTVHGDKYRIKEALLNIVTNANEATDKGRITVRAFRTDPAEVGYSTTIEIEDTGCGVKEEDMERIFDPFFTTRPAGTGLGLSITKRIIEEHEGKIELESVRGKGAIFRILLPHSDQGRPENEEQSEKEEIYEENTDRG
jgi:signal transduction histidine kinase